MSRGALATPRTLLSVERELLEMRLDYERTISVLKFDHAEKLTALEFKFLDTAQKLAASETERRLTTLNHAHEAAVTEQARTLPRELFAQFQKEYEATKIDNAKQFAAITPQFSVISTRNITWMAAIGILFTLVQLGLRLLGR